MRIAHGEHGGLVDVRAGRRRAGRALRIRGSRSRAQLERLLRSIGREFERDPSGPARAHIDRERLPDCDLGLGGPSHRRRRVGCEARGGDRHGGDQEIGNCEPARLHLLRSRALKNAASGFS